MIKRNLVDGLIVGGIPLDEELIRDIKRIGSPLVVIGKYKAFPTHRILVDNFGGAYKAAEHLINEGYKRIALVTGSLAIYSFADKAAGYRSAFQDCGRKIKDEYIIETGGAPEEAGYISMKRLMGLSKKPDAVFITDLSMTVGAIQYIEEYGIKMPEHIGLVAYGHGNLIKTSSGPLTYIHNGDRNIGHAAARLLFDIIDGKASEEYDITISTRLVLGKTSIRR
jgi:DNA-binding LacI/PurR family transcriptional regulator